MQIKVTLEDVVLKRFGNRLGSLGEKGANTVMMRALNHEGDKLRTEVKRALVRQTGIKYGMINHAVKTLRANGNRLVYTLEAQGDETNIGLYNAVQRNAGVSARPWAKRRIFAHTFLLGAVKGTKGASKFEAGKIPVVFMRFGDQKARLPIRKLFGPNLAREFVKGETAEAFRAGTPRIADRIAHEADHYLRGG